MADAYHPYVSEELPLNIPTNKRREREVEASSYEATRPATIAALDESLLASMMDSGSSLFFDDEVGFGSESAGERDDIYDDEYGAGQTSRGSMNGIERTIPDQPDNTTNNPRSEDFIEEKTGSSDRGELSGPRNVIPMWENYQRDSFADADLGVEGGHDDVSSDEDSQIEQQQQQPNDGGQSCGLNNLMTLQSKRKMVVQRLSSTSDVDEYQSEMELFVEDGDDGDVLVEDLVEDEVVKDEEAKPEQTLLRLDSYPEGRGGISSPITMSPRRNNSVLSNDPDDPLMPVDINQVKDMEKEDYWELFNRILSMPTDFVAEDHVDPLEFFKRRDAVRKELRAEQIKQEKEKAKLLKQRQRARARRYYNGPERSRSTEIFEPPNMKRDAPPPRCRSTEIFEPPNMKPRPPPPLPRDAPSARDHPPPRCRSTDVFDEPSSTTKATTSRLTRRSSFGGSTAKERRQQKQPKLSPKSLSRKMQFRFVRPKKPEFVNKTQEFGKKAMASFSFKFHVKDSS